MPSTDLELTSSAAFVDRVTQVLPAISSLKTG